MQAAACGADSQGNTWAHLLPLEQLLSAALQTHVCARLICNPTASIKSIYSVAHLPNHSVFSLVVHMARSSWGQSTLPLVPLSAFSSLLLAKCSAWKAAGRGISHVVSTWLVRAGQLGPEGCRVSKGQFQHRFFCPMPPGRSETTNSDLANRVSSC